MLGVKLAFESEGGMMWHLTRPGNGFGHGQIGEGGFQIIFCLESMKSPHDG